MTSRRRWQIARSSPERKREIIRVPASQPPESSDVIRRIEWVCALALTTLIAFLHVYRASQAGGLWRDEVSTIGAASALVAACAERPEWVV